MASFINDMSNYFKSEAKKYGFPYYEIKDDNFAEDLDNICEEIMTVS
jgi:hypothetical protein